MPVSVFGFWRVGRIYKVEFRLCLRITLSLKTKFAPLRRGISVLLGWVFERLMVFSPRGGNLNKPIFKSSNARGEDVEPSV